VSRTLRLGWARGPSTAAKTGWGQALRLGQTWEVAAWEIPHLGSCHLGKYPWEVDTWEKFFGKVPNINKCVIEEYLYFWKKPRIVKTTSFLFKFSP